MCTKSTNTQTSFWASKARQEAKPYLRCLCPWLSKLRLPNSAERKICLSSPGRSRSLLGDDSINFSMVVDNEPVVIEQGSSSELPCLCTYQSPIQQSFPKFSRHELQLISLRLAVRSTQTKPWASIAEPEFSSAKSWTWTRRPDMCCQLQKTWQHFWGQPKVMVICKGCLWSPCGTRRLITGDFWRKLKETATGLRISPRSGWTSFAANQLMWQIGLFLLLLSVAWGYDSKWEFVSVPPRNSHHWLAGKPINLAGSGGWEGCNIALPSRREHCILRRPTGLKTRVAAIVRTKSPRLFQWSYDDFQENMKVFRNEPSSYSSGEEHRPGDTDKFWGPLCGSLLLTQPSSKSKLLASQWAISPPAASWNVSSTITADPRRPWATTKRGLIGEIALLGVSSYFSFCSPSPFLPRCFAYPPGIPTSLWPFSGRLELPVLCRLIVKYFSEITICEKLQISYVIPWKVLLFQEILRVRDPSKITNRIPSAGIISRQRVCICWSWLSGSRCDDWEISEERCFSQREGEAFSEWRLW